MKNVTRLLVPASILGAGLLCNTTATFAKKEYTAKEKKGCVFCHTAAASKELNDAGKYYKDHDHSLEGYQPKEKK
jgi:cytochrome c551/c552